MGIKTGRRLLCRSSAKKKEPVASRNDECDYIKLYLEEINRTPLLSFEEEIALSKKIQKGDKEALEKLIKANLRLVVKISKQYVTRDYQLMDIVQDGNLGLIKAAEKYDFRREFVFRPTPPGGSNNP